jgi:hypothetical protein
MAVNHSQGFVHRSAPFVHTNTIEGVWGTFKAPGTPCVPGISPFVPATIPLRIHVPVQHSLLSDPCFRTLSRALSKNQHTSGLVPPDTDLLYSQFAGIMRGITNFPADRMPVETATTVYLTANEASAWGRLPVGIRDGWDFREEGLIPADTAEQQASRMVLLRLHDPRLIALQKQLLASQGSGAISLVEAHDLSSIDDADLAELCFVMGPSILTSLLGVLLSRAATVEDLRTIWSLSMIRHALLESDAFPSTA